MGELILFRPRRGLDRSRADLRDPGGADIMLFTGVRYERMVEPTRDNGDLGAPSDGVGGGRKRKRG